MSVYTRTGDDGETDLLGDGRVPKDAARLEVCGPLDELNCWLGLVRCEPLPAEVASLLEGIQRRLFDVCAELVTVAKGRARPAGIASDDVRSLERAIDRCEEKLDSLSGFILPAGSRAAALLHFPCFLWLRRREFDGLAHRAGRCNPQLAVRGRRGALAGQSDRQEGSAARPKRRRPGSGHRHHRPQQSPAR